MASNLGQDKICIHVNLDQHNPKALIYELNAGGDEDSHDTFYGFVDFNNFEDIGIDMRNIRINMCSRFVFLTKSKHLYEGKHRIWMNLLLVDPYNTGIQASLFKSQKIFLMKSSNEYEDLPLKNIVYIDGGDLHLITQFNDALHHTILKVDNYVDLLALENNEVIKDTASVHSKTSKTSNNSAEQANVEAVLEAQLQEKMEQDLELKLKDKMASIIMFQDIEKTSSAIYYATKNKEFGHIELRVFDSSFDVKE